MYYPKKFINKNAEMSVFTRHNTEHNKFILTQTVHHLPVQHIKQKVHSIKYTKIQLTK